MIEPKIMWPYRIVKHKIIKDRTKDATFHQVRDLDCFSKGKYSTLSVLNIWRMS